MRAVEGCLHPQRAALLIVKFDRVAIGLVFEPHPSRPALEAAHHLALVIAMNLSVGLSLMAQKAQDIGAAKMLIP